jgi:hypothetical protein
LLIADRLSCVGLEVRLDQRVRSLPLVRRRWLEALHIMSGDQ